MATTCLELDLPQPFDFKNLLQAHGWVDLLPNCYHAEEISFSRIEELSSAKVVELVIAAPDERVRVAIRHASRLSAGDLREVENRTRHMLRLDEDFTEFYRLCRRMGKPWSAMAPGKGRLLRSPGLFEDIVKVICTTNIQWGGTRRMVANLATDLESFRAKVRGVVEMADESGDRGTANLLDPIADGLDKKLWMMEAYLAG